VKALMCTGREKGEALQVLEAVELANDRQKKRLFEKLERALDGRLRGARVAIWGLAFKPNTDDMREAPSLVLIDALRNVGASVTAHDPAAMTAAQRMVGDGVRFAESNYEAIEDADALVVVTDWNEYRHPDFNRMKAAMKSPVVIDGRNLYNREKMRSLGFVYDSIGRA